MKKTVFIAICFVVAFFSIGCEKTVDTYRCNYCGEEVLDLIETEYERCCYKCIVNKFPEKCVNCGIYYDSHDIDCNEWYCHSCFEEQGKVCFLCWQSFGKMISIEVKGEYYYVCPDCATDYFAKIAPMVPVDYCCECGSVYKLGDFYFEHYIYRGASVCPKCVADLGYEKCNKCEKYTDDGLSDGVCGYCIEKEAQTKQS